MPQATQSAKKQDNYSLSIISTIVGGAALLVALIVMHWFNVPIELAEWTLDVVMAFQGISLISNLVSGNGYFFQLVDKLFRDTTLWQRVREKAKKKSDEDISQGSEPNPSFWQRIKPQLATTIGLVVGIVGAVVTTTLQVVKHLPMIGTFAHAAKFIIDGARFIFNMSTCGGLGNRFGRVIDIFRKPEVITKKHLRTKNINYALAIVGGIIIGIALAVIIIHTGGAALPVALAVLSAVSSSASASGYIGRVFDVNLGKRTIFHAAKDFFLHKVLRRPMPENQKVSTIGQRMNREAIGTTIGVGLGIALGVTLIIAGVATLPFFGLGSIKIVAGVLLLSSCVSVCGGLGNRVGYFLDKFRKKKEEVLAVAPTANVEDVEDAPDPDQHISLTSQPKSDKLAVIAAFKRLGNRISESFTKIFRKKEAEKDESIIVEPMKVEPVKTEIVVNEPLSKSASYSSIQNSLPKLQECLNDKDCVTETKSNGLNQTMDQPLQNKKDLHESIVANLHAFFVNHDITTKPQTSSACSKEAIEEYAASKSDFYRPGSILVG